MTDQPQTQTTLPQPGTKMSADEFLALPPTMTRIELINGVVIYPFGFSIQGEAIMTPPPSINHQRISRNLVKFLLPIIDVGELLFAPVGFHLGDADIVIEPDVVWLAADTQCKSIGGKHFRGAPELAIEILSPSTADRDQSEKLALYEHYGTLEYWLVDEHTHSVAVFHREGEPLVLLGTFGDEDRFDSSALDKTIHFTGVFEGLE